MKGLTLSYTAVTALMFTAAVALAQDAATVTVSESEQYGQFLTDAEGRSLYLFTADTQGEGEADAQASCTGDCLANWPPLYTQGDPQAGEMVDAAMLGTVEHEGQTMVTYNGWPLYYFANDAEPGQTEGQGRGDRWYLIAPTGERIE